MMMLYVLFQFYKLKELVLANTNDPNDPTQSHKHVRGKPRRKTVTIDWTTVSKEMNRQYQSCVVRIIISYIDFQCLEILLKSIRRLLWRRVLSCIDWLIQLVLIITCNHQLLLFTDRSYDVMCYSQNNWKQIQNQSLKQGLFTANEDEFIINKLLEALTEYGELPRGIWVQISHGLNRDLNSVFEHWRQILSKKNWKQIVGTSTSCDIINQQCKT